jgi:hypothetical protein
VLSENLGAIFPVDIAHQENGQLVIGSSVIVPYDPSSGTFVMCTLFNPTTKQNEALRTPTIFKTTALIQAIGNTAIWTPASGKRFRLLGGVVNVPNTSTSAAGTISALFDGATASGITLTAIGATTAGISYTLTLPSNGYLSTAINNALNLNNSAAYTAGGIIVCVWGVEE